MFISPDLEKIPSKILNHFILNAHSVPDLFAKNNRKDNLRVCFLRLLPTDSAAGPRLSTYSMLAFEPHCFVVGLQQLLLMPGVIPGEKGKLNIKI